MKKRLKWQLRDYINEDGSVIMEIVREYGNNKPVGTYLD